MRIHLFLIPLFLAATSVFALPWPGSPETVIPPEGKQAPLPTSSSPTPLSLRDAARLALAHNPALTASAHARAAAAAQVDQARSLRWPRLETNASFTNGNNPVYAFGTRLGQQRFRLEDFAVNRLNHPDAINNLHVSVGIYQSLWEGGKVQAREQMARLGVDIRAAEEEATRQEILYAVLRDYRAITQAREMLETAEAADRSARSSLERVTNLVEQGQTVRSDLLRLETHLADVQRQKLDAAGALASAQAALAADIGEMPGASLPALSALQTLPAEVLPELEVCLRGASEKRPELHQLALAADVARAALRDVKGDYLPSVSAFASLEGNHGTASNSGGGNYTVGVQMRLNLYDGPGRGARLAETRARVASLEAQYRAMAQAVALQVIEAYNRVRTASSQYKVANGAVSSAEEALRIVRNRHEAGLATMTDLLGAETALTVARSSRSQAAYGWQLALGALELAMGRLSPESPLFD